MDNNYLVKGEFTYLVQKVVAVYEVMCSGLPFNRIVFTVTTNFHDTSDYEADMSVCIIDIDSKQHEGCIGHGKTPEAAVMDALNWFMNECERMASIRELTLSDFAFRQPTGLREPSHFT